MNIPLGVDELHKLVDGYAEGHCPLGQVITQYLNNIATHYEPQPLAPLKRRRDGRDGWRKPKK